MSPIVFYRETESGRANHIHFGLDDGNYVGGDDVAEPRGGDWVVYGGSVGQKGLLLYVEEDFELNVDWAGCCGLRE